MKYLVIAVILFSCAETNPKEAIVERQKQIKIEIPIAEKEARMFLDSAVKDDMTPEQEGALIRQAAQKQMRLQKEYDSLQFELKKY